LKQSTRINRFLSYLFYQIINILTPLILIPYLSRRLGPDKLGVVNFYDGLSQTFITIFSAGVLVVATREMSNDKNEESRKLEVSSIFKFHLISIIIGIIFLYVYTYTAYENIDFTLLTCAAFIVFFSAFKFEYIFQGLNSFNFLVKRAFLVRIIFISTVLFFVKSERDFKIYFILLACSSFVYSIISIVNTQKYIYFLKHFSLSTIKNGLKKSYKVSISNILSGIYSNLDILLLYEFVPPRDLGIYIIGVKLVKISVGIINSFSVSEYPNMSKLFFEDKIEVLTNLFKNIYEFVIILTIPILILFSIYSSFIVDFVGGSMFMGSAVILKLVSALVVFSSLNTILINQLAIFHKDVFILTYGAITLFVGGIIFYLLIKSNGILGASITLVLVEIICNIYLMFAVNKLCKISFNFNHYLKVIIVAIISYLFFYLFYSNIFDNIVLNVIFTTISGSIIYYLLLSYISIPIKSYLSRKFWIIG